MKVIITMPAYNEEETIEEVIMDIKNSMLQVLNVNYEIIVVDDGSTDRTVELAKKAGADVISNRMNIGLAKTFKKEVEECIKRKADIIVHLDADGQHNPRDIPSLIQKVISGYDLVLASRFKGTKISMPFIKKIGNKLFSIIISKLVKIKISDGQTGFRAFTRQVGEEINIISNHTYTHEQIITAVKKGFKITEISTVVKDRKSGESRLIINPLEYGLKAAIHILRMYRDFQPLKFFGVFGLILFSIGFLLGLFLLILFIITGGIQQRIPLAILCILFILTGIQVLLFGFLADMKK